MHHFASLLICVAAVVVIGRGSAVSAQYLEEGTVQAATTVLNATMASPLNRIPQSMLANANGVVIIPNVIKGSFIVGARHGRGLLFVREADGVWHAPVFITLTGGNIGWQVGVQSSDIVLVFKTPRSVQGILAGKLTIGVDAAAAAGPVGRQGAIATDGKLQAEVYSYSRSRGLFAGVSIDGSAIQIDRLATGAYYRSPGPGQPALVPPSAQQLTLAIATLAGSPLAGNPPAGNPALNALPTSQVAANNLPLAQRFGAKESDVLRAQLVQIAPELFELLDDPWKTYLALPGSFFSASDQADPVALQTVVDHYDLVARSAPFGQLAARPEFQSVHGLLKHYQQSVTAPPAALKLPPPPGPIQSLAR